MTSLDSFGPYFEVRTDVPAGHGWLPLRALLEPPVLDGRVAAVRTALGGGVSRRVAASTYSLGLFARLVSPVVGAHALGRPLPRPGLDASWWSPVDSGPLPLALTGPLAPADVAGLLEEVVEPLAAAVGSRFSVSRQILGGNAASAVFGAARVVASADAASGRAAHDLAVELLGSGLAGAGTWRDGGFVRASCCLFYRVPGGGYCGDCVLTAGRTRG